jgi:hypothetical protein
MHSGNGTSVRIGNLGLTESMSTNNTMSEISTGNYQLKHGHHSLQFMAWWFFTITKSIARSVPQFATLQPLKWISRTSYAIHTGYGYW